MTLHLKAAKRVLRAAGYDDTEISELVRGIKADAWDKGEDAGERYICNTEIGDNSWAQPVNPYRATQAASLDDRESRGDA